MNLNLDEQKHIDQWWLDTGHNLTQKQAVDAAFALGLKYAQQFAERQTEGTK